MWKMLIIFFMSLSIYVSSLDIEWQTDQEETETMIIKELGEPLTREQMEEALEKINSK